MTQPLKIVYPAASTTSVAAAQTRTGAGALIINGSLLDLAATSQGIARVTLPRIERVISVTSGGNISAAVFTITGYDINLNAQTDTVTGVSGNTVLTTKYFYQVTGWSVDRTIASSASLGTGPAGRSKWKIYDTWVPSGQTAINVKVVSGTVQYTVEYTFDNVMDIDYTEAGVQKIQDPLAIDKTTDGTFAYESPYRAARVSFNSSTTGAAEAKFMQVGGRY